MSISSKWDVILLPYSFIKTGQQDLSLTPLKIISSLRRLLLSLLPTMLVLRFKFYMSFSQLLQLAFRSTLNFFLAKMSIALHMMQNFGVLILHCLSLARTHECTKFEPVTGVCLYFPKASSGLVFNPRVILFKQMPIPSSIFLWFPYPLSCSS